VLDADPRRVKRVRISRLKERREKPRKRGEPDAVLAGTTPPPVSIDDVPAKDGGTPSAEAPATPRRP
jgi:hypothetical protein